MVNTDSQAGGYDISSRLLDPHGQTLSSAATESSVTGHHAAVAPADGDHVLCLDNTYSSFAGKTVYIDMSVEDPPSDEYVYDYGDYIDETVMEDMRKQDLQVSLIQ